MSWESRGRRQAVEEITRMEEEEMVDRWGNDGGDCTMTILPRLYLFNP